MANEIKEKVSFLEDTLNRFILHTDKTIYELSKEMKEFKDEMKEFKDEMREFKVEAEKDRKESTKEWNKKWGSLANKMGTIVEDIISPAVRPVFEKYFKEEIDFISVNVRKKVKALKLRGEFDIMATSAKHVFLVETKSTPSRNDLVEFQNTIKKFNKLFPEYRNLDLVPVLASLRFDESIIPDANEAQIYLMAYREWEYMDILNFDDINPLYSSL